MRFDFSSVDDVDSYVSVPEGVYACRVAEVREGKSRDGSVRWSLRLEVIDGEWAGRTAAWDSLTWSERGVYRVKKAFEAMGLDVRGEVEVEPQDLVDLRAQVRVEPEEREDPMTGRRQVRMRVPYLGYAAIDAALEESTSLESASRESAHRAPVARESTESLPDESAGKVAGRGTRASDAKRVDATNGRHESDGDDDEGDRDAPF